MNIPTILVATSLFATAIAQVPVTQTPAPTAPHYTRIAVYPLTTCAVSGKPLGATPSTFQAAGRTFQTCSDQCQATVEKDPATFVAKLDEALIAQQLPTYPLETCPITGLQLGSMGAPTQLVIDGTLVQLCCRGCTAKAKATAATIVARIHDEAFAQQDESYPLTTCAISGAAFPADVAPVNVMLGTTLVKIATQHGADTIAKAPAKYLAKITAMNPNLAKTSAPAAKGAMAGCCGGPAEKPAEKKSGGCCGAGGSEPVVKPAGGCCGDATGTKKVEPKPAGEPAPKGESKKND